MRNLMIALLMILLTMTLFSQENHREMKEFPAHGVQFQVSPNFSLDRYGDFTFAYRRLLDDDTGLRFGISTNFDSNDEITDESPDSSQFKDKRFTGDIHLKMLSQYLVDLLERNNFTLIAGGGPLIEYIESKVEDERINSYNRFKTSQTTTLYGLGFELISGVEYWLSKNVVVSGEYILEFMYRQKDVEIKSEVWNSGVYNSTERSIDTDSYGITTGSVRLGISVFL